MAIQTKKVIYWVNNIFFLYAFLFLNVFYISMILGKINPIFDIFFDMSDGIIPVMLLSYAVPIITTVLSVCLFRKIISKTTIIFQALSTFLIIFPFLCDYFPINIKTNNFSYFILTILNFCLFVITLVFLIKDSKRFND